MQARHKRHLMHGSHHKHGGHVPPHIGHHKKHRAAGGRAETGGANSSTDGQYSEHEPSLVSGNKNVVKEAKEKKSIGEVPGIYAKKRLDRRHRS